MADTGLFKLAAELKFSFQELASSSASKLRHPFESRMVPETQKWLLNALGTLGSLRLASVNCGFFNGLVLSADVTRPLSTLTNII